MKLIFIVYNIFLLFWTKENSKMTIFSFHKLWITTTEIHSIFQRNHKCKCVHNSFIINLQTNLLYILLLLISNHTKNKILFNINTSQKVNMIIFYHKYFCISQIKSFVVFILYYNLNINTKHSNFTFSLLPQIIQWD